MNRMWQTWLLIPAVLAASHSQVFFVLLTRASESGAPVHWGLFGLGLVLGGWQVRLWAQGHQPAWRYWVIVCLAALTTLELFCAVL